MDRMRQTEPSGGSQDCFARNPAPAHPRLFSRHWPRLGVWFPAAPDCHHAARSARRFLVMKTRSLLGLLTLAPSLALAALDGAKIETATGLKGTLNEAEGVFKVTAPRTDHDHIRTDHIQPR